MLPTNKGSSAYSQSYVSSSFSVVVRTRNLQCLVRIEKTLNVCNRYKTVGEYKAKVTPEMNNNLSVIHQTRETVFHRDIQTLRRELKIQRTAENF